MNYLLFDDRAAALEVMEQMNAYGRQSQGPCFNWSDVLEHPVDLRFALPYDERMSGALNLAQTKGELVDEGEATKQGFYFGPLNGRFYKPLHKCQDAAILADNLAGAYGHAPFPVTRSLFLGALGSLYAVREHLKKTLQGPAAKALPYYGQMQQWWQARKEEMGRTGELLHFLHELNNSEKHGFGPCRLTAQGPLFSSRQGVNLYGQPISRQRCGFASWGRRRVCEFTVFRWIRKMGSFTRPVRHTSGLRIRGRHIHLCYPRVAEDPLGPTAHR